MPRIYINEKDRTSPGTPGGYSNNTVLIAGFAAYSAEEIKANEKAIQADDNGIFEFESATDFERTIGLVAPTAHKTVEGESGPVEANLPAHYGNQMAYELLKMGYPVIYINLGLPYAYEVDEVTGEPTDNLVSVVATKMKELGLDTTWEIFKDKASYDFRFVSHGLLTSSEIAKSDDLIKLESRIAKMVTLLHKYDDELVSLDDYVIVTDLGVEDPIYKDKDGKELTREEVLSEAADRVFAKVKNDELKFIYAKGDASGDITDAAAAIGYTGVVLGACANYDAAVVEVARLQAVADEANQATGTDLFTEADFDAANTAIANLAHYRAIVDSNGDEDEMDPASGRGDCIALVEVDESKYITKVNNKRPEALIVDAVNKMANIDSYNGKYCACTVPSVVYKSVAQPQYFDDNKKFPGAFHYLACFKNSLGLGFAEWYAAAGYTRGVSSYAIDYTSVKLGEVAINALEPRNIKNQDAQPKFAVNVIANFRGSYYLWGNRTCHPLGEAAGGNDLVASHFLNIRQLCTTIKKQLYVSCRRFTFDPNSDVLWINFKNSITPMLERMKADQGIRDYSIAKVYTDKKATIKARIRIVPIEAVEDFLLEVSLEDSLGETAVSITE